MGRQEDRADERSAVGGSAVAGRYPRMMLAAGASGSGKTTVTCGLLQALRNRGLTAASFKCGPDYIDPMFHERVLKTKSRNLDTFFTDAQTTCRLFARNAADADVSVLEGVMGYYDGLGGVSDTASSYDLARVTGTPTILIVDTRGMSLSALAYIRGFLTYRPDSCIQGVILNRMSGSLYPEMKQLIEKELGVKVYGYVPKLTDCMIESRHLGLVMPAEVECLEEKLHRLADTLEKSLEIDALLALARSAPMLPCFGRSEEMKQDTNPSRSAEAGLHTNPSRSAEARLHTNPSRSAEAGLHTDPTRSASEKSLLQILPEAFFDRHWPRIQEVQKAAPVIAVARDEAFCFLYEDNLQLLRDLGARLIEFSPIHDDKVPEAADGMLLYGGYPELHARQLSENVSMLRDVREKIENGLPCMAECGGFLYLHRTMEDMDRKKWKMAGVLDAEAFRTERLTRFGYIEFLGEGSLRGHEFHYYDSTDNGADYLASKPLRNRTWKCMHKRGSLLAGFPHLYYYSNPEFALDFCLQCVEYRKRMDDNLSQIR